MLENETDPDKIKILEFDLAEARGQKDKGVIRRAKGGSEMTDKQKKVRKAAGGGRGGGNYDGDEVLAARRCKGGGIAVKGTDFKGTF